MLMMCDSIMERIDWLKSCIFRVFVCYPENICFRYLLKDFFYSPFYNHNPFRNVKKLFGWKISWLFLLKNQVCLLTNSICYDFFEVEIHNFLIVCLDSEEELYIWSVEMKERKIKVVRQFKFDQIIVLDNKLQSYNCKSILVLQDIMENPTGHGHSLPWSTGYWIFDNLAYNKRESWLAPRERTIVVGGDSRECK